jgi:hypothetical protein
MEEIGLAGWRKPQFPGVCRLEPTACEGSLTAPDRKGNTTNSQSSEPKLLISKLGSDDAGADLFERRLTRS